MKFAVYGKVVGTKYIGTYEAATEEQAREMAEKDDAIYVSLCHHCAGECENPEIDELTIEKSE